MATDRLPCVPYLGLFLTDLCFINEVPSKRGQTDAICNTIAYFQNSTYGGSVIANPVTVIVHIVCVCAYSMGDCVYACMCVALSACYGYCYVPVHATNVDFRMWYHYVYTLRGCFSSGMVLRCKSNL